MDIMTLAAKLVLDDSGFKSGVSAAESAGEKLAGKMSAMTVAVGNIAADMIKTGFNAVKNMIGGAVDAYADYQQLVGGVETLFKTSASKVQQYAKESFKATGLSSNEYMETVTSFSASLLQGLKGDTDAAAELANTAIQDMADNANKMGTDISSIQTAYQGFAKQNYTMLDNLKLGYGGTAGEMVRLVNDSKILDHEIENLDEITFDQLIQAIHEIQKEMGITGTTAQEAEKTITGSAASMKAAWADLMSAVGGEEGEEGNNARLDTTLENFKTSFQTYMDNYIPSLQTTIENVGSLVQGVSEAVAGLPTSMISNLFSSGLTAGVGIMAGVENITNWLIDSIVKTIQDANIDSSKVEAFGKALGHFVGSTVGNIIKNIPAVVDGLFNVGVTLAGSIISGIWDGLFGNGTNSELQKINDELNRTITDAEVQSTKAQAILNYMDELRETYGDAARETGQWKQAERELEEVLGGSTDVFNKYGEDVGGAIEKLKEMTDELRKLAIQQAMQDSLSEQYKLLGTYELNKTYAEVEKGIAVSSMDALTQRAKATASAYADEWLKEYGEGASKSALLEANNLKEGKVWNGTDYVDISQASLGDLVTSLRSFAAAIDKGEDSIWNQDLDDDILDIETLEGLNTEYEKQKAALEDAEEAIKKAEEGIEATNKAISITEEAIKRSVDDINSMSSAAGKAASAFVKAANDLTTNTGTNTGLGAFGDVFSSIFGTKSTPTPRAVGLDYATDGMLAQLHQGEAILTKEENERRRSGSMDFEAMESALEDAIERSMSRMSIDMNGERVASLTSGQIGRNNRRYTNARVRAMGG